MVTYDEYFRDILGHILDSYDTLQALPDRPGDLETINKEILKISALFQAIVNKADGAKSPGRRHDELVLIAQRYLDTYSFDREIAIMAPLYWEDTNRIHNIRAKILESLHDKKLLSKIRWIIEDLS